MEPQIITRQLVADNLRILVADRHFGIAFARHVEPTVFNFAGSLSAEYSGGYWHFYQLSNGGFYMAPHTGHQFKVSAENGFEGVMSADAFGVTCCLYAYSSLSFSGNAVLAETCAENFHWLREYALEHLEVGQIMRAVD